MPAACPPPGLCDTGDPASAAVQPSASRQYPATAAPAAVPSASSGAAGEAAARAPSSTRSAPGRSTSPRTSSPRPSTGSAETLRVLVEGLREVLMTRAAIKSEMRVRQTVVGASGNNPLKFSVSAEQAVEAMVRPGTAGTLDPVEAAREALRDVHAHEVAVMTGMEAALKGLLRDLSPDALEGRVSGGGGLSGLLAGKKARSWDSYRERYAEIAEAAEEDFHELFGREFARAYQAQLERLR